MRARLLKSYQKKAGRVGKIARTRNQGHGIVEMDIATATDMSSGRGSSVGGYLVLTMTDAGRGGRTGRSLKVGGGSGSGRVEGGPPTWDGGWRGTMGLGRWTKGMPRSSPGRTGTGMGTGKGGQARHACRRGNYTVAVRYSRLPMGEKIKSRLCEPRPRIRQPPRAGLGSSSRQRQTNFSRMGIP